MQISCQQAGEPTPEAWTIEQLLGPDIDFSFWFGVDTNPGKFIAKIQDTSDDHTLPVDTLVLIGLPRKSTSNNRYGNGDDLISYAGQRFSRIWGDSKVHPEPLLEFGLGSVTERILGVSAYDPDAVPGGELSETLKVHWMTEDEVFRGYFHSDIVTDEHGAAETRVDSAANIMGTDAPHAALKEIIQWLNPSDTAEPLTITLSLHVVDADSQQPITGAKVYFNANGTSCSSSAERYGVTDIFGNLTKELPFYSLGKYTALVIADGYHQEEFDNDYAGGLTPELSPVNFGTIELQSIPVPTVTSSTGRVWMDRNIGASRVAISQTDEEAYGDLYQWGRCTDGHEKRTSGTTTILSSNDKPGHGDFITANTDPYDWITPQNDNLWEGVNGTNNPCPDGFRIPTYDEWQQERTTWTSDDIFGAFASPLKLVLAGYRNYDSGSLVYDESCNGGYWATDKNYYGLVYNLIFCYSSGTAKWTALNRTYGFSVRCIKDEETLQCGGPEQLAGGDTPEIHSYNMGANSGSFQFDYDTYSIKDRIIIKHDNMQIFDTGCVGESRTVTLDFSGYSSVISVEVIPNCAGSSGTDWTYTVHCPN